MDSKKTPTKKAIGCVGFGGNEAPIKSTTGKSQFAEWYLKEVRKHWPTQETTDKP